MENTILATINRTTDGYETLENLTLTQVPHNLNDDILRCLVLLAIWNDEFGFHVNDDELLNPDDHLDDFFSSFCDDNYSVSDRAGSSYSVYKLEKLSTAEAQAFDVLQSKYAFKQDRFSVAQDLFDYLVRFECNHAYYNDLLSKPNPELHAIVRLMLDKIEAKHTEFNPDWLNELSFSSTVA